MVLGSDACLLADAHHIFSQRRSDSGEVEPVRSFKNGIPVKIRFRRFRDGRVCTVIDADASAGGCTLLQEVNADPVSASGDMFGVHAVLAQAVHRHLSDGMGRKLRHETGIQSVICQGNGYVRLAASKRCLKGIRLHETQVIIGLQTQHQFTESNYFCHILLLPYLCTRWIAKPAISFLKYAALSVTVSSRNS